MLVLTCFVLRVMGYGLRDSCLLLTADLGSLPVLSSVL